MLVPYLGDDWLQVYQGDARDVLAELPAASVHAVVTSPPYWGLRDYGTASWTGGDPEHVHQGSVQRTPAPGSAKQASKRGSTDVRSGDCDCGAHRVDDQLGLEATPDEYVAKLVEIFRELARVLRPDGTVWLNLGDSYAAAKPGAAYGWTNGATSDHDAATIAQYRASRRAGLPRGLKSKDLVGIPWRVAFALQADGWYLRSDVVWSKPNAMPESVTDRPTRSHEYVFLLSRRARYFWDAEAVAEPTTDPEYRDRGKVRPSLDAFFVADPVHGRTKAGLSNQPGGRITRNLRSVWTIPTEPYRDAHFATFPRKLVEPCIRASTSERGVCPECGAPWKRLVERVGPGRRESLDDGWSLVWPDLRDGDAKLPSSWDQELGRHDGIPRGRYGRRIPPGQTLQVGLDHQAALKSVGRRDDAAWSSKTLGWKRSCEHELEPVPATVLDPFAGSGTTGLVAQSLHRRAILVDLSTDYLDQAIKRNRDIPLAGLA